VGVGLLVVHLDEMVAFAALEHEFPSVAPLTETNSAGQTGLALPSHPLGGHSAAFAVEARVFDFFVHVLMLKVSELFTAIS